MTTTSRERFTPASASYAVLRHGGAPACRAREQLGLEPETAIRLERLFHARPGSGVDRMRPRYARHDGHVEAVMAQGGYPVLAGRRR
jgi:hypothetical protein